MKVPFAKEVEELSKLGWIAPLLKDQTTGKNILWGTNEYGYPADSEIKPEQVYKIKRRWEKTSTEKKTRTAKKAEVFTPVWIVKQMIETIDNEYAKDVVTWLEYVGSLRLEICCGEAPFLMTRYEPDTGEWIEPRERTGILDRKFQMILNHEGHNHLLAKQTAEIYAIPSTYGYEYCGDNLLIARVNMFYSFIEFFDVNPERLNKEYFAKMITRNLWQMDGLTGKIPGTETMAEIWDWEIGDKVQFWSLRNEE